MIPCDAFPATGAAGLLGRPGYISATYGAMTDPGLIYVRLLACSDT